MNILIVDDEVSALRDLARTIEKTVQDAEIKKADRALDALSLCREQEFDVVFLDIRMPGKDGLELAKEIKQVRPLINIIMVTAYQQYLYDAVKLYVSDYILKPARAGDIKNALANLGKGCMSTALGILRCSMTGRRSVSAGQRSRNCSPI